MSDSDEESEDFEEDFNSESEDFNSESEDFNSESEDSDIADFVDFADEDLATAEKLRSETAGLAAFVHPAEKRLRELIPLKVAAGFQLCRDVEPFGRFEFTTWRMDALPLNAHVCWCEGCTGYLRDLGGFWIHGREMDNRSSEIHSAAIKGR